MENITKHLFVDVPEFVIEKGVYESMPTGLSDEYKLQRFVQRTRPKREGLWLGAQLVTITLAMYTMLAYRYGIFPDGRIAPIGFSTKIDLEKFDKEYAALMGPDSKLASVYAEMRSEEEKIYPKDPLRTEFFWAYKKHFPNYWKAFEKIGISTKDAMKMVGKKKYLDTMGVIEDMKILEMQGKAIQEAEEDGKHASVVRFFASRSEKNKGSKDAGAKPERPFADSIPEYLKDGSTELSGAESEMDNIDRDLSK